MVIDKHLQVTILLLFIPVILDVQTNQSQNLNMTRELKALDYKIQETEKQQNSDVLLSVLYVEMTIYKH